MSKSLINPMREAGKVVAWFRLPVRWELWNLDIRTHRKVLVCDGSIAFTGGVGIAEQWEGDARKPNEWRDTHFQVEGPAVQGLQAALLDNWVETGQTVREDELALLILEDGVLSELDYHFREDCRRAKEMKAEDYRQRGLFKRAKIMVASLFKSQK